MNLRALLSTHSNTQGSFAAYRELPSTNGFTLKINAGFRFL